MSGIEQVIYADTRNLVTLLNASGTSGLNTLLLSGQRILISKDVLSEMQDVPSALSAKFFNWYNLNKAGNGQVFTPSYLVAPGTPQPGDTSLREIAAIYKDQFLGRFLSDDAGIYLNEKNLGFQSDRLAISSSRLGELKTDHL
jgi:hypothetical protein